jgi:hypothetical protein
LQKRVRAVGQLQPKDGVGPEAYGTTDEALYDYYCYDWTNPGAHPSVISNNSMHDNAGYGFYSDEILYATYSNNVAKHNDSNGMYLDDPGHAVFSGNIANENWGYFVQFGFADPDTSSSRESA